MCDEVYDDVSVHDSADKGDYGFVSLNDSRVTVRYDGCVRWTVPLIVQSACAVDVTYFPFDNQKCFIRFGSWIYDETQVNLSLKNATVDQSSYSLNTEMDLLKVGRNWRRDGAVERKEKINVLELFRKHSR